MIKLKDLSKIECTTPIPMNELKEGEIARVVRSDVIVMAQLARSDAKELMVFLVLGDSGYGEDFDFYYENCTESVVILPPNFKVCLEFSNSIRD